MFETPRRGDDDCCRRLRLSEISVQLPNALTISWIMLTISLKGLSSSGGKGDILMDDESKFWEMLALSSDRWSCFC
jgi:hypothetical protein